MSQIKQKRESSDVNFELYINFNENLFWRRLTTRDLITYGPVILINKTDLVSVIFLPYF